MMKQMDLASLALVSAGSRNCGNWWQTYWVTTTCGIAGGMIGLAFGGIGSSVGAILGKSTCTWICHYAC